MEFIVEGFINNNRDFQMEFDNEADAREEFERRKSSCVEVNLWGKNEHLDAFNKPFSEG